MLENTDKKEEWLFFYVDEGQITDDFYARIYSKFKNVKAKGIANTA